MRVFATIGAIFGLLQALIAIAYYTSHADATQRVGLSYTAITGIYVAGGSVGGALFGTLRRFAVTRLRAALAGVAVTLPEFCALTLGMMGAANWFPAGAMIAVGASIVMGAGLAIVIFDESPSRLSR